MGLFNKIFDRNKSDSVAELSKVHWIALTSEEQLEEILKESYNLPIAIFKHSSRCGISRMVLKSFERDYSLDESQMKLYFLDLLNFRNISNKIAAKFNVYHQSPQLLIIKDGVVIWYASHETINQINFSDVL